MIAGEYSKTCLISSTCSETARIDAIYDYVGAVYGKRGRVTFDGQLTPAEKEYIIATFGRLSSTRQQDVATFMSRARTLFFEGSHLKAWRGPQCSNPFSLKEYSNPALGAAYAIGGSHNCGEQYTALFAGHNLEFAVAANPSQWIFFIEGYMGGLKDLPEEGAFFANLAATLNIPIQDPLRVGTDHWDTIDTTAKKTKRPAIEYVSVISINMFIRSLLPGIPLEAHPDLFTKICEYLATIYPFTAQQIETAAYGLLGRGAAEEKLHVWTQLTDHPEKLHKTEFEKLIPRIKELTTTANETNQSLVQADLKKIPQRNKALFVIGAGHFSLVEAVYKTK